MTTAATFAGGTGMTGASRQLHALLSLRWQMARAPGVRFAMAFAGLTVALILYAVVSTAGTLEPTVLATVVELAPSAYLGFGALALIAPLTAGGGNEVVPPDQLVAYPVRPATQFYGGLVLAPLNLVWIAQLITIVALTGYLTLGGSFAVGAVTSGAYVVAVTVLGQALAWAVVGLRSTRTGRRVVTAIGLALLAAGIVVVRLGLGNDLLSISPTRSVSRAVLAGGAGEYGRWATPTLILLALVIVGLAAGRRTCAWALRRPSDVGTATLTTAVRRRAPQRSALRELVAIDRASVWRAPALRRGGLVLVILPGALAAGAAVPWQSLVVLPGLVAAGAGLLFGVNAFCLDGSGAVWLASLPHDPVLALRAKAIVLAETVLGAVVISALAGSLRSPGSPTAGEVSAIVASGLVASAAVVALALRASVRRPHRADLKGPRDAVAPPGALAMASARLATPTALIGVLFGSASRVNGWYPLVLAVPLLLLCALSLWRSLRRYRDPAVRARIVQVVSAG